MCTNFLSKLDFTAPSFACSCSKVSQGTPCFSISFLISKISSSVPGKSATFDYIAKLLVVPAVAVDPSIL